MMVLESSITIPSYMILASGRRLTADSCQLMLATEPCSLYFKFRASSQVQSRSLEEQDLLWLSSFLELLSSGVFKPWSIKTAPSSTRQDSSLELATFLSLKLHRLTLPWRWGLTHEAAVSSFNQWSRWTPHFRCQPWKTCTAISFVSDKTTSLAGSTSEGPVMHIFKMLPQLDFS